MGDAMGGGTDAPAGVLQVVSTPIGNLGDLTPRAASALCDADLVCAEDTRRTGRLLAHVGSDRPQWALHDHNERAQVPAVLARLQAGETVALVSDAGTPGVSDPGHRLISAAVHAGIRIEPVPGASAVLAALVVSGLPMDRFVMEGFLPRKGAARGRRLSEAVSEQRTMVWFVTPHRATSDLAALADALGTDRPAVVVREATKLHEDVVHDTLGGLADRMSDVRGELTVVVAGRPADVAAPRPHDDDLRARVATVAATGQSPRAAVKVVAAEVGMPTRELYDLVHRQS